MYKLRVVCQSLWLNAHEFLFFFDKIRFWKYLAILHETDECKIHKSYKRRLYSLKSKCFGNALSYTEKQILNHSD